MTPKEIALVRQGFDQIAPMAQAAGELFYQKLFALDPSLRPLFCGEVAAQAGHLMAALAMVVRSLDDLGPVVGQIQALGRRHAAYGVQARMFDTVGQAFLATLEAGLGDSFTPDARAAWTAAYTLLAGAMIAAMAETEHEAA